MPTVAPALPAWTCPFCALLCDEFGLDDVDTRPMLRGSSCPRAQASLDAHVRVASATPRVNGIEVTWDAALDAAAVRLSKWRQPLFAGLGTDVAGSRAAYRLVERTGAICDTASGAALVHGLRALQDRGQYTATLAEVRARADLVVCVGTNAVSRYPEFFRRAGLDVEKAPCETLVFLEAEPPVGLAVRASVQHVVGTGDLADDLQQLAALVNGKPVLVSSSSLQELANRLLAAKYAVIVWEPGMLPPHGALIAEALQRIVATLNRSTRAASLALGGNEGAASVNQVFTWLSGLPVRTRHGATGLEHDPLRFDGLRLMDDRAVDGLVWISSFDPRSTPPIEAAGLPRIVLAPPAALAAKGSASKSANTTASTGSNAAATATATAIATATADEIFLPVSTPGLNAAGHLFRTDGIVIVPLEAARDDGLRSVADVLAAIEKRLRLPPTASTSVPISSVGASAAATSPGAGSTPTGAHP